MNNKPTALYRHYDSENKLLYVGISLNPFTRLKQHSAIAEWVRRAVSMTTEWYDNRFLALEAEKNAIKSERPVFNIVHNIIVDSLHDRNDIQTISDKNDHQSFFSKVVVPRLFVCSSIFQTFQGQSKSKLFNEKIYNFLGLDILYSGDSLNQTDLDVWVSVYNMSLLCDGHGELEITPYMLLKILSKGDGGRERAWLDESLLRMSACTINTSYKGELIYSGSLINKVDGHYHISIGQELINSFDYIDFFDAIRCLIKQVA